MRPQHPSPERRTDRDGVTRVTPARSGPGAGVWILGGGVVFTVLCLALSAWLLSAPPEVEDPLPVVEAPRPARPRPEPVVARAPVRPAPTPVSPAPVVQEEPEVVPPPEEDAPPSAGPTGLALYQRGTKPLKRGIVVPEDFPLPAGYLRHYQATDDGSQVSPILMFHPDYKPLDPSGQPIALPENRVVPPEMAPPGMPIQMLELPTDEAGNPT